MLLPVKLCYLMKTCVRNDNFGLEDWYFDSSCANFSEEPKVIYDIRWPYVPACQGGYCFTPVVPAKLLIVPPYPHNCHSLNDKLHDHSITSVLSDLSGLSI